MQPYSYPAFVASRAKAMTNDVENLLHAAVGIAGEAGELLDAIKKHWVHGKPLDLDNVVEELGDLEFYMQHMRNALAVDREAVIDANVLKLEKRYPSGYTDAAAIARADKGPEQVELADVYAIRRQNLADLIEGRQKGARSRLARYLEVSPAMVGHYIAEPGSSRQRTIGAETAERIESFFGLPIGALSRFGAAQETGRREPGEAAA